MLEIQYIGYWKVLRGLSHTKEPMKMTTFSFSSFSVFTFNTVIPDSYSVASLDHVYELGPCPGSGVQLVRDWLIPLPPGVLVLQIQQSNVKLGTRLELLYILGGDI